MGEGSLFEGLFDRFFTFLARHIAARPWPFLLIPFLFSLLCVAGNYKFVLENDQSKLWVPLDSNMSSITADFEKTFGPSYEYALSLFLQLKMKRKVRIIHQK